MTIRVYEIYETLGGRYGVGQKVKNACDWDHAEQHGYYDTPEKAEAWVSDHSSKSEYTVTRLF